ncbi:MAG: prepilin-type N-terminal cleavage/methylation domain-containing protein [Spirochaetaceae bacterium]|nr:prepilin-type N-terminal cleavage/methylation domain-containing protein [Spirochaetaceae bacterium]
MVRKKDFIAFTLIEVLIAIIILSISLLALYKSNIVTIGSERRAENLEYGVLASDLIMKDAIKGGFPSTGVSEGEFKEGAYKGVKWKRTVESFNLPMLEDLRKITVEVYWGKNNSYRLTTIVSKYR